MHLNYPYQIDARGYTAITANPDYIRDLIEQVLFTAPGERINRPTFGSGLMQLIFAPNSDPLAAATQLMVQGALQQWLGDWILVELVDVEVQEGQLQVTVQYVIRQTQQRQVSQFQRGGIS